MVDSCVVLSSPHSLPGRHSTRGRTPPHTRALHTRTFFALLCATLLGPRVGRTGETRQDGRRLTGWRALGTVKTLLTLFWADGSLLPACSVPRHIVPGAELSIHHYCLSADVRHTWTLLRARRRGTGWVGACLLPFHPSPIISRYPAGLYCAPTPAHAARARGRCFQHCSRAAACTGLPAFHLPYHISSDAHASLYCAAGGRTFGR